MSTQSQSTSSLTNNEIDRKVNEVIHLLLIWEQKKIPIKRADINKHVLKDYKSLHNNVMQLAKKKLDRIFGMRLVEIGEGPKKCLILVNKLKHKEAIEVMQWNGNEKRGLLFIILTLIFMNGNVLLEEHLWNALKVLGIDKVQPHPIHGLVKKVIHNEFARQMYIQIVKTANCDPPRFQYKWGLRAIHEIGKKEILEFVTKLYGKSDISIWKSQYQDMIGEAERGIVQIDQ